MRTWLALRHVFITSHTKILLAEAVQRARILLVALDHAGVNTDPNSKGTKILATFDIMHKS